MMRNKYDTKIQKLKDNLDLFNREFNARSYIMQNERKRKRRVRALAMFGVVAIIFILLFAFT